MKHYPVGAVVWITLVITFASGNDCPAFDSAVQPDICSFNDTNGVILSIPAANCSLYTNTHCCFDGKTCYNKRPPENNNVTESSDEDVFEIPQTEENKPTGSRRVIGVCGGPKKFPDSCEFIRGVPVPYVLEPPTNIPYCLRIPCTTDRSQQARYDKSLKECGSQAGCYFDRELSTLRKKFGESVLPGVPICHYAIRSLGFHKQAVKVVAKYGYWNPYFTNCILEQFKEEIEEGPIGCKFLAYMEAFRVPPKFAGWKNINPWDCRLIGGCWRDTLGCFYPAEINKVNVKSGQRTAFNPFELRYGRPRCQLINTANPYEVLKGLHQCLASGCSLDEAYARAYFPLLYKIGEKMPNLKDHWDYWNQVKEGGVTLKDVIEGIKWKWNNDFGNGFNLEALEKIPQRSVPYPQIPPCDPLTLSLGLRPCVPRYKIPAKSPCPFRTLAQYSSLKGSLDGCCDINPCYLAKRDIREMHSGPAYYYTPWGAFGPCSVTSGNGVATRRRKCVSHDNVLCTEPDKETSICGNWASWSGWSSCTHRTSNAWICLKKRSRGCSTGDISDCNGQREQSQACLCSFVG